MGQRHLVSNQTAILRALQSAEHHKLSGRVTATTRPQWTVQISSLYIQDATVCVGCVGAEATRWRRRTNQQATVTFLFFHHRYEFTAQIIDARNDKTIVLGMPETLSYERVVEHTEHGLLPSGMGSVIILFLAAALLALWFA